MVEKISTQSGIVLIVEKSVKRDRVEVSVRTDMPKKCLLHWGLRRNIRAAWQLPPQSVWPKGSKAFDQMAVQSPFWGSNGYGRIILRLDGTLDFSLIDFVLFFPEAGEWDNNQGRNYQIEIPGRERLTLTPIQILKQEIEKETIVYERVYLLEDDQQLAVVISKGGTQHRATLITDITGPLILHWGVAKPSRYDWALPPRSLLPAGTVLSKKEAAQTRFVDQDGFRRLCIEMGGKEAPLGILFVLKQLDTGRWLKYRGLNFFLPVSALTDNACSVGTDLAGLCYEIIEREMGGNPWSLMHRFNLCYDLLDTVRNNSDGLALIFVWLRFSALRQLDWQRNYNTKPKELAFSLDRLTFALADHYVHAPAGDQFIRLMMTLLGRGGEGQQIRDEILNIMHRHHIKEVSGHFLEEWHQKLHNNTTADDVVICEAYLEFLGSEGNLDRFYERLRKGGVTKERLEGFERPIKSHPDFIPHLKKALIHDFEHFQWILKKLHSGSDLGTAIDAARYLFDPWMHGLMEFVWMHRGNSTLGAYTLVEKITEGRRWLHRRLEDNQAVRDILFLDLALEDFLRVVVERNLHLEINRDELIGLIALVLENLCLSDKEKELQCCFSHWERLKKIPGTGKGWALQADAAVDRLSRVLGNSMDFYYQMLQPKAEFLGRAFNADPWVISLFSEEVVRGRPAFVLSMLLGRLGSMLRKTDGLAKWQVIGRGRGIGQVEVVSTLKSIQGKRFSRPTIIITDKVAGNEEIPEGVTGIVTPDTTDVLSHVAIRARNADLFFATCYDPGLLQPLKSLKGHRVKLSVNAAGDVVIEEGPAEEDLALPRTRSVRGSISRPYFTSYAVSFSNFNEKNVGGKSYNLKQVRDRLPEWVGIPASVALPFGVFEKVLSERNNTHIARRYKDLSRRVDKEGEDVKGKLLDKLRKSILGLRAPEELISSFFTVMEEAGLERPTSWEDAWNCIKRVWSSKWNERAYLSRRANDIPHGQLSMAVLIQRVVEADYSFVIHTVNPFSGNRDEIYAEVVLGLGETLVGNSPGRALSFTCRKGGHDPNIRAFPSKSVGLYGSGLIFRSDSNGEDLGNYAGAGIYDSVMLEPAQDVCLDYTHDPLVWDEDFRRDLMVTITTLGSMVEEARGAPQDIEGAYAGGKYWVVQTRPQVGIDSE
jgi:alpha-glucan,water dikinase